GSIWRKPSIHRRGGGLANYNSAVCLSALFSLNRPELLPVIQNLRTYLTKTQYLTPGKYRGGIGYDLEQEREYADLSNSFMVYDAMRLTEEVEDLRAAGNAKADLDWEAVQAFLSQVQNLPSVNTNSWVSDSEEDLGGFVYTPSAGPASVKDDQVKLRSYGSMTYAGLLSLIYANVDKADERVQAARNWATRHWTLDENPGMGEEGLYYFFNILTKSLAAFGDDMIELPDGRNVVWRQEVIRRLLELQHEDGFWVNENNRWWEANPALVTSYTLLALFHALQ
ncbi:MAG: cycloartenol synthase, partial [Verrucomicrobiota bacterium]|nr:cycloartenol synthase [Verrucomicrobiota bacterium]